jgi:DNA-directed RNA polymerase subunit RPC12/RpoP
MDIQEIAATEDTLELDMAGRRLACTVCGNKTFRKRETVMSSRAKAFFHMEWAGEKATNYICTECGYVFWFLPG